MHMQCAHRQAGIWCNLLFPFFFFAQPRNHKSIMEPSVCTVCVHSCPYAHMFMSDNVPFSESGLIGKFLSPPLSSSISLQLTFSLHLILSPDQRGSPQSQFSTCSSSQGLWRTHRREDYDLVGCSPKAIAWGRRRNQDHVCF